MCFPLLAGALLLIDVRGRKGGAPAHWLALAAVLVASVPIIGYGYGMQQLYGIARFTGIALHTAVAQVFNQRGDGMIVRGGQASRKDGRQPYLDFVQELSRRPAMWKPRTFHIDETFYGDDAAAIEPVTGDYPPLGDVLDIEVVPARLGRSSFDLRFTARTDGADCVTATITYVSVDPATHKPAPVPDDVRRQFEATIPA